MNSNEIIRNFAEYCFKKYNIEIQPSIIKDYIETINPLKQSINNVHSINSHYKVNECSSNNVSCSHVSFDSVRCNNCEYDNTTSH
jgi:phenylalanyl-tRNA synthetase alpha subunit